MYVEASCRPKPMWVKKANRPSMQIETLKVNEKLNSDGQQYKNDTHVQTENDEHEASCDTE